MLSLSKHRRAFLPARKQAHQICRIGGCRTARNAERSGAFAPANGRQRVEPFRARTAGRSASAERTRPTSRGIYSRDRSSFEPRCVLAKKSKRSPSRRKKTGRAPPGGGQGNGEGCVGENCRWFKRGGRRRDTAVDRSASFRLASLFALHQASCFRRSMTRR